MHIFRWFTGADYYSPYYSWDVQLTQPPTPHPATPPATFAPICIICLWESCLLRGQNRLGYVLCHRDSLQCVKCLDSLSGKCTQSSKWSVHTVEGCAAFIVRRWVGGVGKARALRPGSLPELGQNARPRGAPSWTREGGGGRKGFTERFAPRTVCAVTMSREDRELQPAFRSPHPSHQLGHCSIAIKPAEKIEWRGEGKDLLPLKTLFWKILSVDLMVSGKWLTICA